MELNGLSRPKILELLTELSKFSSELVQETTLPTLFAALPDSAPPKHELSEHVRYRGILASLGTLCTPPPLFETLVIRMTSKLDLLCRPHPIDVDLENSAAYAYAILSTLSDVTVRKVENKHNDLAKYGERLVLPLYGIFLETSVSPADVHSVTSNSRVLLMAAKLINLITRTLNRE